MHRTDSQSESDDIRLCPSAQPDMDGARVIGIVAGTAGQPRVRWTTQPLPVTDELLGLATSVEPTEVFRFAAPCAESGCQHYDGSNCRLGEKLVRDVHVELSTLPPCSIRRSCRWFAERGRAICSRCPEVVTLDYRASPEVRQAADPLV